MTYAIRIVGGTRDRQVYLRADPLSSAVEVTIGVAQVAVTRADFLAAVQSELNVRIVPADAIVIEHSELPEATEDGVLNPNGHRCKVVERDTPENLRAWGLTYLALAAQCAARPPVDEAQVQAVVDVLMDDPRFGTGRLAIATGVARRLVEAGVRIDVTP
ncbi:MAG: hypothetical protein M0Z51_16860 [Propionibacterium sp.]|nr:hypothetical protein [Propionibacterium sp.]